MALMDFIKKQFIDVIHWTEETDGVLAYRFPMQDMEIQNGAQLTVRESQMAGFVNEGIMADVFNPGRFKLTTQVLPLLTNLMNWDKLFDAPFKSDVYFFSTRLQLDRKWGTPNPITIRDKDFGAVRLRAFGIYSYRITDPKLFHKEVSGTRETYTVADLDGQLRNSMIAAMTNAFGASGVAFLDMAGNQLAFAEAVRKQADPMFAKMGLGLDTLVVENISLPEEIQKMLDTRIGMNMIGDMNKYTQFQTANAIPIAAANEGGGIAAMGAQLAAGVGIGNQMAGAMIGGMLGNQGNPGGGMAGAAATVGGSGPQGNGTAGSAAGSSIDDITATLEKLHGLVGKGILSQAEFDTKKAELLAKLG
jgi:membrane protease subunit (stomatin/prohibitin family)